MTVKKPPDPVKAPKKWEKYQADNEDDEATREQNARAQAQRDNEYAQQQARERQEQEARDGADVG